METLYFHKVQAMRFQFIPPRTIIIVLVLLFSSIIYLEAQSNTASNIPDSIQIKKMNDVAWDLMFSNPDAALTKIDSSFKLAENINFIGGMIDAKSIKGSIMAQIYGDFNGSIQFYNEALKLAEQHNYFKELQAIRGNIGVISMEIGDYELAESRLNEMLSSAIYQSDTMDIINSYGNLGTLNNRKGAFHKAIEYFKKAVTQCDNQCEAKILVPIFQNAAGVYIGLEMYQEALNYADRAVALIDSTLEYRRYPLLNSRATCLIRLDSIEKAKTVLAEIKAGTKSENTLFYYHYNYSYIHENSLDSALYHIDQMLGIAERRDASFNQGVALLFKAKVFRKKGDLKRSKILLDESIKLLSSSNSLLDKTDLAKEKFLQELSKSNSNAEEYYSSYRSLRDSLKGEILRSKVLEVEINYKIKAKQDSIQLLIERQETMTVRAQSQKNNNTFLSILALILFGTALLIYYFFVNTKKKNSIIEQRKNQIETLKTEMNHRVRNNLQLLSSFMSAQSLRSENSEVKQVLNDGKNRIQAMAQVHQELNAENDSDSIAAKKYLTNLIALIQTSLVGEKELSIRTEIDDMDLTLKESTRIGLIVNELMTNALKHGYPSKHSELKLEIKFKKEPKNQMCLSVLDNGKGLPEDFDLKQTKGLGINLIHLLVKELKGTFTYTRIEKSIFEIRYKLKDASK